MELLVRRPSSSLHDRLNEVERAQILGTLEAMAWNTSRAADHLGVARNTLRYRIKKLRLERPLVTTPPVRSGE